jgi:hypothetical protein
MYPEPPIGIFFPVDHFWTGIVTLLEGDLAPLKRDEMMMWAALRGPGAVVHNASTALSFSVVTDRFIDLPLLA